MQHKSLDELRGVADVIEAKPPTTRRDKLERWATLLASQPDTAFKTLQGIEYVRRSEQAPLRTDNSLMTVAFDDPVLRAAGLKSDRYGDIMDFFELSHGEAHRLVCSCHNGSFVKGSRAARDVRRVATHHREKVLAVSAAAMVAASPLLFVLF